MAGNRKQLEADIAAIVQLNAWKKASTYNFIVESQTCIDPVVVHLEPSDGDPVVGRMMLFPGINNYRDYAIWKQVPNAVLATSPLEMRHWELIAFKDGKGELHWFRPGFMPHQVTGKEECALLAPIVHECLGVLIREEEEPQLLARYAKERSLFARREGLDGKWRDAPFVAPKEPPAPKEVCVALGKEACLKAQHLPIIPDDKWEVDFLCVPMWHTDEAEPRLLYLFAAFDAHTRERRIWTKMSVSPTDENGLEELWELLAGLLLKEIVRGGRVPGTIAVRSAKVMRYLRPLGIQVPIKFLQQGKLPVLDAELAKAVEGKGF